MAARAAVVIGCSCGSNRWTKFPVRRSVNAEILYATNGIEVLGMPGHSPLAGETAESTTANDVLGSAQPLGNLLDERSQCDQRGRRSFGGDRCRLVRIHTRLRLDSGDRGCQRRRQDLVDDLRHRLRGWSVATRHDDLRVRRQRQSRAGQSRFESRGRPAGCRTGCRHGRLVARELRYAGRVHWIGPDASRRGAGGQHGPVLRGDLVQRPAGVGHECHLRRQFHEHAGPARTGQLRHSELPKTTSASAGT